MPNHDIRPRSSLRCGRCQELLGPEDQFCSVCGAARESTASQDSPRRGLRLFVGSALVLAVVFAAVIWIYLSAPERQTERVVGRVSLGSSVALAIASGTPPTIYLATADRLLTSRDGGSTWTTTPLAAPARALAASAGQPAVVYLAGARLWEVRGTSLEPLLGDPPPGEIHALAVDPGEPSRLYALVSGRVERSDDAGRRWTVLGTSAPTDATSLAATGGAGGPLLYLGTAEHGVFASGDGQGWSNASGFVNGALPTRVVASVAFDPRSGDRSVNPAGRASTGALYAGTDRGLFKSVDEGVSWGSLPFHRPIAALAVAPDGSHFVLAVTTDGSVYRSEDGGVSWR